MNNETYWGIGLGLLGLLNILTLIKIVQIAGLRKETRALTKETAILNKEARQINEESGEGWKRGEVSEWPNTDWDERA